MGKIAIVGCEASGKTVFMSALADHYRPDAEGRPCLVPENSEANHFTEFGRRQMRALRQWPPATNPGKTVEMKWSLRENGRVIASIGMLEFGGETFRAAFRGDDEPDQQRAAVTSLLSYLAESDSIILLISIKELLRDPAGRSVEEFERGTESIWVSRGLLEFVRKNLPRAAVVIGLTQADRYCDELRQFNGARGLLAAKWPTIGAIVGSIPVVEVASVSATDADGMPAPDYTTDGIVPIMDELFRQQHTRKPRGNRLRPLLLLGLLAAAGAATWYSFNLEPPKLEDTYIILMPKPLIEPTNTVTAATEATTPVETDPCTNTVVETAATNTVVETAATNAVVETDAPITEECAATPVLPPAITTFSNRYARALAGDAAAQRWIGTQYYKGSAAVSNDLAEARRFFTLAAEAGDTRAEVHLAVMCENGLGGPVDAETAMAWYRKAADAGHPDALYRVATDRCKQAPSDPEVIAEAHELFLRAQASGCKITNLTDWISRTAPKPDAPETPAK